MMVLIIHVKGQGACKQYTHFKVERNMLSVVLVVAVVC